jgi:ribose 5-phosphate isomerase B
MATLALASDHAGFALKALLADELRAAGHDVLDLGPMNEDRVDYPDFGAALAAAIAEGRASRGIAVCGSGIGISMAVNREPKVRCALVTCGLMARLARQHNDANCIALGARLIGVDVARECVHEFLETAFEGGRHADRVAKLGQGPRLLGATI